MQFSTNVRYYAVQNSICIYVHEGTPSTNGKTLPKFCFSLVDLRGRTACLVPHLFSLLMQMHYFTYF